MKSSIDIATSFYHGGKVSVRESRQLANALLDARKRIEQLEREVERLGGGKTVELRSWPENGRPSDFDKLDTRVWTFTCADKSTGGADMVLSNLNKLLSFGIENKAFDFNYQTLSGPEHHLRRFLEINGLITRLLQEAYDEGYKDGRSVIIGLANGSVSLADLNAFEEVVEQRRHIRLPGQEG